MDTFLNSDDFDIQEARKTARKAIVLSSTRYQQGLHSFIAGARDQEEFNARLGLAEDDLKQIVEAACEEVGHDDVDGIVASIVLTAKQHFADKDKEEDEKPAEGEPSENASLPWEKDEEEDEKTSATKVAEGTPIPKMDKRKWTPRSLGDLPKDKADGPHPTVRQDVTERAKPDNSEKLEQIGEQVTEHQDVTKKVDNIHGGPTKTFPKGNQANPVTAAAQDVGRNPIQDILDNQATPGFVDPTEADRIISLHNAR